MNQQIQSYLKQVMRHSGLSKREKVEWLEEMSAHLNEETARLKSCGHEENEATAMALQKFGEPSMLRRKISRDTFGLSVSTIFYLVSICFVLFFVDLYVLQLQMPRSWYQTYPNTWDYLFSMLSTVPLSPFLMLALCISFLAMFKTRRRADRAGIVLTLSIFGVLWVLIRLPLSSYANGLLFGFKDLTTMEPSVNIICGILVVWGLFLYVWTKNRWISILPTLLSIAVGIWSPIWIYSSKPPANYQDAQAFMMWMFIAVAVRCVPILLLIPTFKLADNYIT
ncbi:MAG: permease prefix domain 1-containing protein [Bacilli bacterium]